MTPTTREIQTTAAAYLADLSAVTPMDWEELRLVEQERGWIRAIEHFTKAGLLTPEGREEAWKILAAGEDWVRTIQDAPVPSVDALDVWGESLGE